MISLQTRILAKFTSLMLVILFLSGPTFPPIDEYPDPGGTKLMAEVEMPECYPCGSN